VLKEHYLSQLRKAFRADQTEGFKVLLRYPAGRRLIDDNWLLLLLAEGGESELLHLYLGLEAIQRQARLNDLLCSAAGEGNLQSLKTWLGYGAELHADADRAIQKAAKNGHIDVIEFILSKGFERSALNQALESAISPMARDISISDRLEKVMRLLLQAGGDATGQSAGAEANWLRLPRR
jgi:hypothetical protein